MLVRRVLFVLVIVHVLVLVIVHLLLLVFLVCTAGLSYNIEFHENFSSYTKHVYYLLVTIKTSLKIPQDFPDHTSGLLPDCFQTASRILPDCFQTTTKLHSRLLPDCFQAASRLLSDCFETASRLHPDCLPREYVKRNSSLTR